MIRREGVVRHTQGGAIQSLRHGTDRLCTEASRTIGHGVAARTIFVEARPQMTAEDNSDTIVDKAAVSDGTHSVHEVQVFHLRDQAIDGALDAIRSALGRHLPLGVMLVHFAVDGVGPILDRRLPMKGDRPTVNRIRVLRDNGTVDTIR
mmetsp:Transcript_10677/g.24891  ORF Transcript_10677/g.24891 Transcript_10677/m.24891 type:complete len:149 (-) Transcript_10677:396-842(-)